MTKEQEAIKYFNNFTKYTKQLAKDEESVNGKTIYQKDLEKRAEHLETVLNMLKEKDKEIEKYKYLYQKALDNTVKADRENIKKDKQIDLILDKINENYNKIFNNDEVKEIIEIYENIKDKNKLKGLDLRKECIKNFFERKSEE